MNKVRNPMFKYIDLCLVSPAFREMEGAGNDRFYDDTLVPLNLSRRDSPLNLSMKMSLGQSQSCLLKQGIMCAVTLQEDDHLSVEKTAAFALCQLSQSAPSNSHVSNLHTSVQRHMDLKESASTPPDVKLDTNAGSPAPSAEDSAPSAGDYAPSAKDPVPSAGDSTPSAKDPAPSAKDPVPSAEDHTPSAGDSTPSAEDSASLSTVAFQTRTKRHGKRNMKRKQPSLSKHNLRKRISR